MAFVDQKNSFIHLEVFKENLLVKVCYVLLSKISCLKEYKGRLGISTGLALNGHKST